MSEHVLAGLASLPGRESSLEQVVDAIAPQVEQLHVSLNGHHRVPSFLGRHPNVFPTLRPSNGGDAEKFAAVDEWDGLVVTVDDDIAYPPDYVGRLVDGLDRHRGSLVSFHGGTTAGWNGSHGAASVKKIRCLGALDADDVDVNVLGTGTLAWHTDLVPIFRDVFRNANMADVHLAAHAHRFGIPMAALAHSEGWLRDIQPAGPSIYESNRAADGSARDTRAARKAELDLVDWAEPARRPRVRVSVATCARPHLLPALLDDLEREARHIDLDVAVYEDPTDADYAFARAQAAENGWAWFRFPERLGKREHWQLVDQELRDCRDSGADWFVFLPDDVRLVRHALPRAIDLWSRLEEPATLTLWRLKDHEGQTNWTGLTPVERAHGFEVFHVDGIYLCGWETLDMLGFHCPKVTLGPASSGVGRATSLRLHAAGKRMYRVARSLAIPVPGEPSVMNPDAGDRVHPGVIAA